MIFSALLSRITGFEIAGFPFGRFFGGCWSTIGAVLARIGGNSCPRTGTPPTPRSVWPGIGRLMMGKALPAPREPGFGIGSGLIVDFRAWVLLSREPPHGLLKTSGELSLSRLSIGRFGSALDMLALPDEGSRASDSVARTWLLNSTMRPGGY